MRRRRKRSKYSAIKKKRNTSYRDAPLPVWFFTAPAGTCRWCNKSVFRANGLPSNGRWHKECLHPYFMLTRQSYVKREVKKRDKGICAKCGTQCRYKNEWDLDHAKPLIEANGNLWYWSLENLQTLCKKCHKIKTASENSARRIK